MSVPKPADGVMVPESSEKKHDYSFARDRQLQNKLLAADDNFVHEPPPILQTVSVYGLKPSNIKDKASEVTGWCPKDKVSLRKTEENALTKPRTSGGPRENYGKGDARARRDPQDLSFTFRHYPVSETYRYIDQYRREHTCSDSTNSASIRSEFLELQRFYAYRAHTSYSHPTTVGVPPASAPQTYTKKEQAVSSQRPADSSQYRAQKYKLSPCINVRSDTDVSREKTVEDQRGSPLGANGNASRIAIHAISKTPIAKVSTKVTVPANHSMISPSLNKTLRATRKISSPKSTPPVWDNTIGAVRTLDTLACVASSGDKETLQKSLVKQSDKDKLGSSTGQDTCHSVDSDARKQLVCQYCSTKVHGDTAQPRSCRGLCENMAERSHSTDGGSVQQSEPIMYEDWSFRIKSCAKLFTGGCGDKKQNHSCQCSLKKSSLPLTGSSDTQPDTVFSGEETAHSHDISKSEVQDSNSVESGYGTTHRHLLCKAPANADLPHGSTCKSSSLSCTPGQCCSGLQFLPKHVPPESINQHQSPLHRASVADTVRGSDTCAHTAISAVNSTGGSMHKGVSRSPKALEFREDTGESSSQRGEVSSYRGQFSQQRLDTPKKKSVSPPHPILVYFKEGSKMTQCGSSTLTHGDQGNFSRKFPLRWLAPDFLFRSELIGQPPSHAGSCWRPRTCPATFGGHSSSIHGNSFHTQSMAHSGSPSVNTMGGSVQRRVNIKTRGYSPQPSSFYRHWPLYSESSSICLSKSIQEKVNQKVKGLQSDKGLRTEHTRSRSLVAMTVGLEHSNCNLSTMMVDGTSCGLRDTEDVSV